MRVPLLGLGVLAAGVLLCVASLVATDRALKTVETPTAAAATDGTMVGMDMSSGSTTSTVKGQSYAGAKPDNADELAAAREPFPAELPTRRQPARSPTSIWSSKDVTVEIAPGVKYAAWGFEGGVPGPIVHVRQGQTVKMTLTNGGAIPHSIDFHAARIAPNQAFRDVNPGESFTFTLHGERRGRLHVPLRHQAGARAHRQRDVRRDHRRPGDAAAQGRPRVRARGRRVLPQNGDGLSKPAAFDMNKAHTMAPDWVTFNGYAGQYVAHPLTADPNELVRFYVVAAGPSLQTSTFTSSGRSSTRSIPLPT